MSLPSPHPSETVVVTGASSGIGEALARELASRGHGLSLVARRGRQLEQLAQELRDAHAVQVSIHQTDLARDRARRRLLDELDGDPRDVVGLCNNAGVGAIGTFWEQPPGEEVHLVRLNVLALHELTAELVGPMVRRGRGSILNVSSVLAFAPFPGNLTYAATKAFVQSFSEGLHAELAGTGVSCTAVAPGPTRTDVFAASNAAGAADLGPDVLWHEADEVATAAVDAMERGRRTVVPGAANRLYALIGQLTPRTVLLPVTWALGGDRARRLAKTLG